MGNNLSNPEREFLATAATSFISSATSSDATILQCGMTGLLQQTQSAQLQSSISVDPRSKKKQQCRWCIETFDRKFNKDRHEVRKHAAELAAAAADASALEAAGAAPVPAVASEQSSRKRSRDDEGEERPSAESTDHESNTSLAEIEQPGNQPKRARTHGSSSDSAAAAAATKAVAAAMQDDEQPRAAH